ncbi:hypothetical protein M2160_007865 [Streptomyces sp. SAI-117]|uniref:DUF5134 domain-containing protein n=1 Tax=unclassified Streptomyces TaxID=2593676 RepID=UPI002475C673|nr:MULTISPECIES: DUF5134 domain-containing protein [unclassified Streptomyces]MDH6553765.1 hypothetical protein [Streptomyces sp. SAI-041]MDH6572844.1 hypothetical protein [Streptomyces sp. SAI-117]MDH6582194.1 hypothetical protein [Streptomyces sp. SAI-133]
MGTPVVLVHCLLTLLFVAVLLHAPARGVGSPRIGFGVRVDQVLAAAMAVSMAAMPWIDVRAGSAAVAGGVFTAGAVWFLLPVGRRDGGRRAAMLHRLPHAVGMAAMAWMLRVPNTGTGPAHVHLGSAAHSHGPGALGAGVPLGSSVITLSLASCLLAYALWSLTRPMPSLRSTVSAARRAAAATPSRHVGEGAMALGTAVMLVLPH